MPVPVRRPSGARLASPSAMPGTPVRVRTAAPGDGLTAWRLHPGIALGALGLLVAYLALLLPHGAVVELTREDGVFESLGALALFCCAAICGVLAWRGRRTSPRLLVLVLVGLAAVFFVGGAEEISWGQRILGIETPDRLAEVNRQEEITLHNLEGASGAAGPLFTIFWATFGVLIPAAAAISPRLRALAGRLTPVLPLAVGALLVANYALLKLVSARLPEGAYHGDITIGHATTEIMEALSAILLAVGLAAVLRARARWGATTAD